MVDVIAGNTNVKNLIKRFERILTSNGCFQYHLKYEKMLENILGSKNHVRSRWVSTKCRHYFV
jgi:hypothetical protein